MEPHTTRRVALFVDFDNIFLGLKTDSAEAAEVFATRPDRWLRWIELGMPAVADREESTPQNTVLIRKCYLNPDTFGRYRPYFTRSGFQVIDCPPLTGRGKNSSDIVMVMDILDALKHETRFERFFIMSGDADFTPVLQRLRAHDRRTAALVSGLVAPAYRAACDLLVDEDRFIENGLEITDGALSPRATAVPNSSATPALLDRMARRVYERASTHGSVTASDLPSVYREFPEFTPTSHWLGYLSLRALTEALVARRPDLKLIEEDPWCVAAIGPVGLNDAAPAQRNNASPGAPDHGTLYDRVLLTVAELVRRAEEPVHMASAAQQVIRSCGDQILDSHWLGKRTFKELLLSLPEQPFAIHVAAGSPGYIYDPERHTLPEAAPSRDGLEEVPEPLASFIRRVNQLTETPKLAPHRFTILFDVLAKELGRSPYALVSTSRSVRDECLERGEAISRQSVTFVLRGLNYVGYRLEKEEPHKARDIADAFKGNVLTLLRQAQAEITLDDVGMLEAWLTPDNAVPAVPKAQLVPA